MATSSSGSGDELKFIKKLSATILVRAGHQYCLKKQYKSGAGIWECVLRKKEKCRGSVTINVSIFCCNKSPYFLFLREAF